jgi:hypothetical protein
MMALKNTLPAYRYSTIQVWINVSHETFGLIYGFTVLICNFWIVITFSCVYNK